MDGAGGDERIDHRLAGYLPTWKPKLPWVVCVSTESTCQVTLYLPGGSEPTLRRMTLPLMLLP